MVNPIQLAAQVQRRYRDYLLTTFSFRDPELRESFRKKLESGHLSRGPYIEAPPTFEKEQTTAELIREVLGKKDIERGFLEALDGDRRLYRHQAEAIRRAMAGANVVVATGTASGKTEAFLYPILLSLYQEFEAGTLCSGVRAIILYPMNALANDQRERLGGIAKKLKDSGSSFWFTFGRYTGETPEDETDYEREAPECERNRLPGELVFRSEMRNQPPHILITNYSMLEYLLIRPADSLLFDNGRGKWWRFIVLDEVHQYRGARATEMAMLLRRLKQRIEAGGRKGGFQCIATSATLAGGREDREAVAQFSSDLFDAPFRADDIILASTVPVPEASERRLSVAEYATIMKALDKPAPEGLAELERVAARLGVSPVRSSAPKVVAGFLLERDGRATALRRALGEGPRLVEELADELFPELPRPDRPAALTELVELLSRAEHPQTGAPLLSARYHLFLRSLEGAYVSYWPRKEVFLERGSPEGCGVLFEVALCNECGQHYLLGGKHRNGVRWSSPIRDPADPDFGVAFFRVIEGAHHTARADARPSGTGEDGKKEKGIQWRVCAACGLVWSADAPSPLANTDECPHPRVLELVEAPSPQDEDRADRIVKCGVCEYRSHDPVREVTHGSDGPHAVIVTTVHQQLPAPRRKIVCFTDGRQDAAFFAWYLDRTHTDIVHRRLLLVALNTLVPKSAGGISLQALVRRVAELSRRHGLVPASYSDVDIEHHSWVAVYREFLTEQRRISLEGVGLLRWRIEWPGWFTVPHVLLAEPWCLDEEQALNLIFVLLDMLRNRGAVDLRAPKQISLRWKDLNLRRESPSFVELSSGMRRGSRAIRWDGWKTKHFLYLSKLIRRKIGTGFARAEIQAVLRELWEHFRMCDEAAPRRGEGLLSFDRGGYRLNPDWWRADVVAPSQRLYRCDVCGGLQGVSVEGICVPTGCEGTLIPVTLKDLGENHYRSLYLERELIPLRVEEHTAQLNSKMASTYQREFKKGRIHVLSCSTTFELGVDLGDLDVIFLRNVPPEAFNYLQRVGRAGRRQGFPGFAVTYCRRSPHDLYHFHRPERLLAGKVRPPVFTLTNEKIIKRHVGAVVLGHFFRKNPHRFQSVETLLGGFDSPDIIEAVQKHVIAHRDEITAALRCIVPRPAWEMVGLDNGSWTYDVVGPHSPLAEACYEVAHDYRETKSHERQWADMGNYQDADWAKRRARTIAEEDVLSFLSRKAVIPKYGFPVDVVQLSVISERSSLGLELQRDLSLAIAEYAPSSKVVADKKEIESYALKRVAGREWERRHYKRCSRHGVFIQWEHGHPEPESPCGDRLEPRTYVIPRFGFVTSRKPLGEPKGRPVRVFTTRPYFAGLMEQSSGGAVVPEHVPLVRIHKACPGRMVILCEGRRGRGFYVCFECGAGFRYLPARPRSRGRGRDRWPAEATHETPYGRPCSGSLQRVSLGHEFVTDILRLDFLLPVSGAGDPMWFSYSLAYALLEGVAQVLDIPSTDLNATVSHAGGPAVPARDSLPNPIVIYDNVPGGAGLVASIEDPLKFRECLEAALERVSGRCGCDASSSCYGCLQSYRNQFAHRHLQRGPVASYLETLLDRWGA